MKQKNPSKLKLLAAALVCLGSFGAAQAGSFSTDFNSGLPAGSAVFGNSVISTNGGFTNTGCLKLTTALNSQSAGYVITDDLDAGQPVVSFTAKFKVLIGGGTGADGLCFSFAPDVPNGTMNEKGAPSTGLTVSFHTYSAGAGDTVPSIVVYLGGSEVTRASVPLRLNTFVDAVVQLHPDGTLDVIYDDARAFSNLNLGFAPAVGSRFGFGGRTGGSTDNHFIDNLSITTQTAISPYIDSFSPLGRNVRGDAPITINLVDNTTAVDTNTIVLQLDGTNMVPTITQSAPNTTINFVAPAIFASGSAHSVSLSFADNTTPIPLTNTLQYAFTVGTYAPMPTNLVAAASLVSADPGFTIHVSQLDVNLGPTVTRAENQLAGVLIDPATSLPYTNLATPNPNDLSFTYLENNVVNYSLTQDQGDFMGDAPMPGIPGTTGGAANVALDAVTYLLLSPGFYNLGVNSSDGFRLTVAGNPDLFATEKAIFNGTRAAADSTLTFSISQAGYYPFRVLYFAGGVEVVNPGTTDPSLEFFSVDANGVKILINDANVAGYVPAYRAAATLPYIRSVSPGVGDTGVARGSAIDVTLVNGSITVQTNTILLQLNGTTITPIVTTSSGVTTVHYQPPTTLALNSTNTVLVAFTDSAANRRTNSYQFVVENILTQLWVIPPASATNATWAKWVNSGGLERGLAYNPKSGHVLLVSRGAATGADAPAGGGVGVFDGNTGLFIKKLDLGSGVISGGTFAVNMVDVADDGAIYLCNLATSAAQNFRIYRWQDENSTPTIAYSGAPSAAAGNPRWGDDFCVRGSGAGTQIITSGNNASANTVPIFSTTNGIDFAVSVLVPTSLPNASVRLGLAFGCGNTFYGETTGAGNPVRYVSFNGPQSTAASLTASYTIADKTGAQSIGPIGVDIANQRLIGDSTTGGSAPHSMNLFDLNLLTTTTTNAPIDSKSFAVSVGTFGTGAVDFTPDGSRVYTLDSGSGVIAFSLAPKLAAPSICAQPQNHIIPAGNLGFFGVGAIGSTMAYQWRLNGIAISGATNRTVDIPNVQTGNLGNYTVVITNSLGSVTSSIALLDFPLIITNPPASQVVAVGSPATFSVGASGFTPFTYQWKLNGTNIAGATGSSLTITNAQVANAGAYTAVVTDPLGVTATSVVAGLTVGTLGSGTGLNGDYYTDQLKTFTNAPTLSRIDPTINFDWTASSPDPLISVDHFTIRWTGQVQPLYSQIYTFYTRTDDGVRLWVNGQKVVDKWIDQPATESSGAITLAANEKYDVVLEYYENAVSASATLSWSSTGQAKQIIPQTQLYPPTSPLSTTLGSGFNGTNQVLNWVGSFQLQSATNVVGPYLDVPGAVTGPYTNNVGAAPEMFYRLRNQ